MLNNLKYTRKFNTFNGNILIHVVNELLKEEVKICPV